MKICEIFRSLQGEGHLQGRPCTFVRCGGCNLSCRWCDTVYAQTGGAEISLKMIIDQVHTLQTRYVCITGGEPLLQVEEVKGLARSLDEEGIQVDIETNGTRDFTPLQPFASICMDVKCPSSGEVSNLSLLPLLTPADTAKFVVQDEEDCRYLARVLASFPIASEIFVSPVFGSDYHPIVRFILDHDLPVRFQVQLHRILGVP